MNLNISIDLENEGTWEDSIAELLKSAIEQALLAEVKRVIKAERESLDKAAKRLVKDAISELETKRGEELAVLVRAKLKELKGG